MCLETYIRFGVLEDNEWQAEVLLGQADQVLSEQSLSGAIFLPLAAVQERHHPLEGIFHVALGGGLVMQKPRLLVGSVSQFFPATPSCPGAAATRQR